MNSSLLPALGLFGPVLVDIGAMIMDGLILILLAGLVRSGATPAVTKDEHQHVVSGGQL